MPGCLAIFFFSGCMATCYLGDVGDVGGREGGRGGEGRGGEGRGGEERDVWDAMAGMSPQSFKFLHFTNQIQLEGDSFGRRCMFEVGWAGLGKTKSGSPGCLPPYI